MIVFRDVSFAYPHAPALALAHVLAHVDVELAPAEALAIVGRSGCGKTTLLHLATGLLAPTSGTVTRSTGARVAMVFQQPRLFPWSSALDNAAFGLRCAGMSRREARARAAPLLAHLGLGDHLAAPPRRLSEGMKHRVAIARALLVEPALLVLDEPFAALDLVTRRNLHEDLRRLRAERRFAMMLVSHAIDDVVELADRALLLGGAPTRVLRDVRLADARDARYGQVLELASAQTEWGARRSSP